jgi:hypothetical protein
MKTQTVEAENLLVADIVELLDATQVKITKVENTRIYTPLGAAPAVKVTLADGQCFKLHAHQRVPIMR